MNSLCKLYEASKPVHWALIAVFSMFAGTWSWYRTKDDSSGVLPLPHPIFYAFLSLFVVAAVAALVAFATTGRLKNGGVTGGLIILLGLIVTDVLLNQVSNDPTKYVESVMTVASGLLIGLILDHALEKNARGTEE